jgi:hypothetical protein
MTLTTSLRVLHEQYVEAINNAVAEDRMDLVEQLSAEYDREAMAMIGAEVLRAA